MLRFSKYNGIHNTWDSKLERISEESKLTEWVATEKVHGANFSVWITKDDSQEEQKSAETNVKCSYARRNGILNDGENFFNHEKTAERNFLREKAVNIYREMEKISPVRELVLFGEICGGVYDHPQVPKLHKKDATKMNVGVHYSNENLILFFDIRVDGKYLDFDVSKKLFEKNDLPQVPLLIRGTYEEVDKYDYKFITKIPEMLSLPAIENNYAEGIVIKPARETLLPGGSRLMIKKKIDKFSEIFLGLDPQELANGRINSIYSDIVPYLTKNRLDNMKSKIDPKTKHKRVINMLVADAFKDYKDATPNNCIDALSKDDYMDLKKELIKYIVKHVLN